MSKFDKIQKALDTGADPAMLCDMCSWDVNCVEVPSAPDVNKDEVMERFDEFSRHVIEEDPEALAGLPEARKHISLLIDERVKHATTVTRICPVLALRLQQNEGRKIADGMKAVMQGLSAATETETEVVA